MNKVAIIGGSRTPFVKAATVFKDYSLQDLGTHVLRAAVDKYNLNPESIDEFVFSTVLLDPRTPNWAREILYAAGLPKKIYAQSVSNNCISGIVAVCDVAERIMLGRTSLGLAGGSESMSNPPLMFGLKSSKKFLKLSRSKSITEKLLNLSAFKLKDFFPVPPGVAEPSTGKSMGQHMEITAKEWNIERAIQDEIAYNSHKNASAATKDGLLSEFIAPLNGVAKDLIIRSDTTVEKLAKLKPVFDRSEKGTLTAGNSSSLTDGASVVVLMSEAKAKETGNKVLAYIKDYQFSAISADDGLLMAPGVAVPELLIRNNLKLEDFDLIEVHEAFSAQVEANIRAWENGWKHPSVGKLDRSKLNVLGGSIALGHPFAATGGRILLHLSRELERRNLKRGLISICAAGAMAAAMIVER